MGNSCRSNERIVATDTLTGRYKECCGLGVDAGDTQVESKYRNDIENRFHEGASSQVTFLRVGPCYADQKLRSRDGSQSHRLIANR